MKNVVKKVVSLAMAATLTIASMTACGSEEKSDVFKIGGIGPLTGAAATYGNAVNNGAKLAVDEINAAGGINGYKIEFKFEDDEHNEEKSVNAYNRLKDWGMQALMGTVTTKPCLAVIEYSHADSMFQLTPSGSAVDCVKYDNTWRVCFSDPSQGTLAAQYIGQKDLATKVAVIYNSSDPYSSGIYETFAAEAKNQPFEVVAAEAFTDDNKSDFSVHLQKASEAGAELVFLPIYYQEASLILSQGSGKYDFKYFGCDGLDGILTMEGFDTKLAEGVMLLTPFAADAQDEQTKKFVEAYKKAYNDEVPNQFAADAYDAIYTIKAAMEEGKCTPDMTPADICKAMNEAMTKITIDGATGKMTWDASGEPAKTPKAVVITDGVYKAH